MNDKKVNAVFCKKCKGENCHCTGYEVKDGTDYSQFQVEQWVCEDCGCEFEIGATYGLEYFSYRDSNGDWEDQDYKFAPKE